MKKTIFVDIHLFWYFCGMQLVIGILAGCLLAPKLEDFDPSVLAEWLSTNQANAAEGPLEIFEPVPDPPYTIVLPEGDAPLERQTLKGPRSLRVGDILTIEQGTRIRSVRIVGTATLGPGEGPCWYSDARERRKLGATCAATLWCNAPDETKGGQEHWHAGRQIAICAPVNW